MKKLLTLVLVLVLCLSVLGSCAIKDKINSLLGKDPVEEPNEKTALDSAVSFLFDLYKDSAKETPVNYNLVNVVTIEGVAYAVTWTVDNELITIVPNETDENLVTVVVPAAGSKDVPYVLTATVTDSEGNTKSKTFDRVVPMFKVNTAAEYYAAEKGDLVIVEGIITGIAAKSQGSYNTLYLNDLKGEGAYYVYKFAGSEDLITDLKLEIGMTVRVSGTKDIYSGTHEIIDAAVEIIDSTVKTVTPVDYTSIFTGAADLKDEALVGKQGLLVTIKGVTIGDVGSNGYRHFTLGDKTSYVRISSSSNCMSADDVTAFEEAFVANKGNIADVTGVISIYSGNFYLVPVSVNAYSNFVTPDRTDAEKVAFELDGVTVTDKVAVDTELTLPAAGTQYADVKFAWTAEGIEIVDGKINVVLGDEEYTFTLKVVATLGEESAEKTFTVAVDAIKKGSISLTPETMGLTGFDGYNAEESTVTVFGTTFAYVQLAGSYGDGLRMRDSEKDGEYRTSKLWNTTALGKGIKKITLTWYPTKSTYDNSDAVIFTFGNEVKGDAYSTKLSTVAGQMVYTITPDVDTYTYFYIEHDINYTFYYDSIEIEFESDGEIVITDEEKVATEKNAVKVDKTEFADNGTLTLNTTPVMYDDVVITWTANGEPVVDNVINIVLGREEQTIVLLATITSGEVTDTKEFTVTVAKMPTIQIEEVDVPVAGVEYKFYLNQVKNGEKLYFNGNPESASVSYRLETTNAIGKALSVYLENAYAEDGTTVLGYRIYFFVGETKTYLRLYERKAGAAGSGSGSLEFVTETPTEYYTYNETYKTLILTTVATDSTEETPTYNSYYLGTYGDYVTISANHTKYIKDDNLETSGGQYPTHFATFYCLHEYAGDCDLVCNECGAERTSETPHTYTADCDADCNVCGHVREDAIAHVPGEDDGDCTTDILCTVCGEVAVAGAKAHAGQDDNDCTTAVMCTNPGCTKEAVAAKAEHVAKDDDGDCTTAVTCESCAHVMVEAKTHVAGEDDGDCTTAIMCTNPGCTKEAVAAAAAHVQAADDGDCTTAVTCENCAHVMVEAKSHVAGADDGDCSTAILCTNEGCTCEAVAGIKHSYTDCDDTTCDNEGCEATREPVDHLYQHECSDKCHECGAENENAVDCADTNNDDKCDYCGAEMDKTGDTTTVPVP